MTFLQMKCCLQLLQSIINQLPNSPHWHDASPDDEFVQVAITNTKNGYTVWLAPVTNEEYNSKEK
jgi:hypothetical protein